MPLIRLAIAIAVPQQNDAVGRGRISTGFAHQEIHDNAGNATDLPLGATGFGNEYIAIAQAEHGSGVVWTVGKGANHQPLRCKMGRSYTGTPGTNAPLLASYMLERKSNSRYIYTHI